MSERDSQVFALYERHRWQDQLTYYTNRRNEYDAANGQALTLITVLMGATTVVSILASFDTPERRPIWTVLAVLLPALSTAVASYARLYAFERLTTAYGAAIGGLRRAVALSPGVLEPADEAYEAALATYVGSVEAVFRRETSQWGQLASDVEAPADTAQSRASPRPRSTE